jgi:hypothetical protein
VVVVAPRCPHRVESRPSLLPALRNLLDDARAEPTGALTIPDASLDPRLRTVRDDGLDLRSLALFPLPAARRCVAALVVASTGEEARWIPDDAELAHLLAMVATLGPALVRIRTRHANAEFERMSRWLGERMTEREKLDWMDVFSASLVHEFTDMLLVIAANAQFLQERLGDCEEIGEILLAVRAAADAIRTVAVPAHRVANAPTALASASSPLTTFP